MITVNDLQKRTILVRDGQLFMFGGQTVDDEPTDYDVMYNVFAYTYTDGMDVEKPFFTLENGGVSRKIFPGTGWEETVIGFLHLAALVDALNEHGFERG